MEELIKQTGTGPKLTGYEKVAILLGELDNEAYYKVMSELSLSRKQFHKIRKAMKKLGKYNPHDYRLYAANEKIGICLTGAKRNRFPRGEAVERSETDEEWRNRAIFHAVRKKGTI